MGLYWWDYKWNPFHYPTWEVAQTLTVFPTHRVHDFAEKAMFVMCPCLFIQVFAIGTGDAFALVLWVLAALLNGPI
jgi:hypothetical protein